MYILQLTVRDLAGDLEVDVSVPLDEPGTVAELVDRIVGLLKWPRLDSRGAPVRYVALEPAARRPLADSLTLADAGIFRGSTIALAPAGGGPR